MAGKLQVRQVGFLHNLKNDPRSPESFPFPACLTSLMEAIGEDVGIETIESHGREWMKRSMNDAILAASGMAFGLLWHEDICPSSFDLMQINKHDDTIKYAMDYLGYDYEILAKSANGDNQEALWQRMVQSLDQGRPVLAFGIIGPPECSLVCGYDEEGQTLYGWSHFQSYAPEDCDENGMFKSQSWFDGLWKIVLIGDKKESKSHLADIIKRGIKLSRQNWIDGFFAGPAAYDAWENNTKHNKYDQMSDEELKAAYDFHHKLVGNHAEARAYLGMFLRKEAGDDAELQRIAGLYDEIHTLCREIWHVAGGFENPDAYLSFREPQKRQEIADLIGKVEQLDLQASDGLMMWQAAR